MSRYTGLCASRDTLALATIVRSVEIDSLGDDFPIVTPPHDNCFRAGSGASSAPVGSSEPSATVAVTRVPCPGAVSILSFPPMADTRSVILVSPVPVVPGSNPRPVSLIVRVSVCSSARPVIVQHRCRVRRA